MFRSFLVLDILDFAAKSMNRFIITTLFILSQGALSRPLNIAHRGSSGMMPEHTLEAYKLAIQQGADIIECDVSVTKDFQLICAHESWINHTTNVAEHSEFRNRVRTYKVAGHGEITDYFTIDFTLAELKTLGRVQQHSYRDHRFDGLFKIATLDEYIDLAQREDVGIYPEIKDPIFINSFLPDDLRFEDMIIETLHDRGYTTPESKCFLQSFDEDSLWYVAQRTDLRLIKLMENDVDDEKLDQWSGSFYGVGPWKNLIVPSWSTEHGNKNALGNATDFVERLHARNLKIHPWTFRAEDRYLSYDYGQDIHAEFEMFLNLKIDGFFTDFPASLARFLNLQ